MYQILLLAAGLLPLAAADLHVCPAENNFNATAATQHLWNGETWDLYRIGWLVAACATLLTILISVFHIVMHCLNYRRKYEQRQIVRIIGMPLVYSIIGWFSYVDFRDWTFYNLGETVYEALTIAAFTMLLILYIGESREQQARVMGAKEKRKLVFPFNCWRVRPSKPYFLFALKWSVLQYAFLRPIISVIGIICEAYDVLCPTMYSPFFAEGYLDALDFISISVALYGLLMFYVICKPDLASRRPLNKFLSIKMIIMVAFYQGFIFDIMEDYDVIKPTAVLTSSNIADGLNSLCICLEMVGFSIWMLFAFSWREYSTLPDAQGWTNPLWAFFHSQNYWDFIREFALTFRFYKDYKNNVAGTHGGDKPAMQQRPQSAFDLSAAYNGQGTYNNRLAPPKGRTDPEKGGVGAYSPIDAQSQGWVPPPEAGGIPDGEMETVPITPKVAPGQGAMLGRGWEDGLQRAGSIESHAPRPVAGSVGWQSHARSDSQSSWGSQGTATKPWQ